MSTELQNVIAEAIAEATGEPFTPVDAKPVGGGCINDARLFSDGKRSYFVKYNSAEAAGDFAAEAEALEAIAHTGTIRVPEPVARGTTNGRAFLALEAFQLGSGSTQGWRRMGEQLAALHGHAAEKFGWHRDNNIGGTPQSNGWLDSWAEFFRERRLRPQLERARANGYDFSKTGDLLEAVTASLCDHNPRPSLLHGDLWAGNAAFTADGTPLIYDPASYYGDRETDLAFSEFFGGFPPAFYEAYNASSPLSEGYGPRKTIYNLYHVLNHANLFGGAYAAEAKQMIDRIIRFSRNSG
ncbi:MAG: fructosamine kinase family protein [Opitutales bacterium]